MENLTGNTEKSALSIVAIDGAAIRRVREAKKLTQLYVASVVGVTTDTISRWENNRYPTIKRDNAEKLATALEVDILEILRQETVGEENPPEEPSLPPARKLPPILIIPVVAIFAVIAVLAVFAYRQTASSPKAVRWLPPHGAPGQIIPVQVRVDHRGGESAGLIIKERFPAGWRFVGSNPPVTGEIGANEVKWLIPGGSGPVKISYTLLIPLDAQLSSRGDYGGETVLSFGGKTRTVKTGGAGSLAVGGYHWADANGDGKIDDNEIMPAYYLTEEMKGLGLDWKVIESIWNGHGYRWDDRLKVFEVVR